MRELLESQSTADPSANALLHGKCPALLDWLKRLAKLARLTRLVREPALSFLALIAAFWPVWLWLAARAKSDSSDAWGLISLATALALLWRDRAQLATARLQWTFTILLLLGYGASYAFVPPLVHAIIAMSAIATTCSSLWYGSRIDLRLWGLLLLALPLVPTLNFYLGYPLRVVVGEAASALLQLNGLAVVRDGTELLWNGKQVSIDAPCSGVKMLWTGLYSSCALAAVFRLEGARFLLLAAFAVFVVLMGNVLRATALFYVEAGFVPQAAPAHEAIGIIVFAVAAILIAIGAVQLRGAAHERQ